MKHKTSEKLAERHEAAEIRRTAAVVCFAVKIFTFQVTAHIELFCRRIAMCKRLISFYITCPCNIHDDGSTKFILQILANKRRKQNVSPII